MDKIKGWKTLGVMLLVTLTGILESAEVTNVVSQYPGQVTTVIGFVGMALRFVTSSSVFKS